MIGKTTKGNGFGGVLRYVFEKPGAKYIGGNMVGRTPTELAREFRAIAKRSKKVKIPVAHISFSPSPQEHLDDLQALEFAQAYMEKIGFGDCQWVLAGHDDTKTPEGKERPHFHIIANRVRITDGRVVTAWRDWRRSELALRELEQEFNLVRVQPSWELDKSAASRGQTQRVRKEFHEFEQGKRDKPPDLPVKVQLQNVIDHAAIDHPRLPQLIERLQDAGVEVKVGYTRTGKVKGISYKQAELTFSGTQLGRAYTFPGLIKHQGVRYDSLIDDEAIQIRLIRTVQSPTQATPQLSEAQALDFQEIHLTIQRERVQLIASVITKLLKSHEKRDKNRQLNATIRRLEGKNYILVEDKTQNQIYLIAKDGRGKLLQINPDSGASGSLNLKAEDVHNFERIAQKLVQEKQVQQSRNGGNPLEQY